MVNVISEKCQQNHVYPLIKMCPKQAINQECYNSPTVNKNKRDECKICVKNCPYNVFEEN